MKIIFLILITLNIIKFTFNKCRMQQTCDVHQPDCRPGPANDTEPEILLGMDVICPDYYNKTACCNNGQNILLKNNFDSLDSVFGSKYGGCDICSINLKRFWCHFTCSPDQDKFMTSLKFQDFTIDNVNYTLLMINLNMNRQMNCDLFNSCKKTKYASQVVAMSNAIGFTTFQGTEAYRKSPVFISMNYTKDEGLNFTTDSCDTQPVDGMVRGFHVDDTCKCNSCSKSCHYDTRTTLPVLQGFSIAYVGLFYFAVIMFTVMIYVCKCYYRKQNPNDFSRTSSLNSEYPHENSVTMNNSKNNINFNRSIEASR